MHFFDIKTAEKALQFGAKKCKTMLVGKNIEEIHRTKLCVDQWPKEHKKQKNSEETHLEETFIGNVEMGQCDDQKYLDFTISSSDNNMASSILYYNLKENELRAREKIEDSDMRQLLGTTK